ncbi:alpha/beta hydrolase [Pseudomonas putida]
MYINSNGVRLHVKDQGEGSPALIFLHYWGGSSSTWDAVVAALPSHWRIVRPDLRGWGNSQQTPPVQQSLSFTLDDFAADVMAIVDTLGLEHYVLIGHSMGGKIAQLIASRQPAGLVGLILVAPAPPGPLQLPAQALAAMATAYESEASVNGAIDHMLTAKPLSQDQRHQVVEDSLRGSPAAKTAWPQVTSREDISQHVASISVPTWVIAGALDKVDPVATLHSHLLSKIPHAQLHVLAETGHLSPLESPNQVAQLINAFITAIL